MHLQLSIGREYHTDLYGLSRAQAHRLITQVSEQSDGEAEIRVRLEPETQAEEQFVRRPSATDYCPVCQVAGSFPIIPHGSCDAYCAICGADWLTKDERSGEQYSEGYEVER